MALQAAERKHKKKEKEAVFTVTLRIRPKRIRPSKKRAPVPPTPITKEMFAKVAFFTDRANGLFSLRNEWETLSAQDKAPYLQKADTYFLRPISEWPSDVTNLYGKNLAMAN